MSYRKYKRIEDTVATETKGNTRTKENCMRRTNRNVNQALWGEGDFNSLKLVRL